MYNISWPTECSGKTAFDDLKTCFDSKNLSSTSQIPCRNGYESVFQTTMFTSTVTTEWQLVCDNQWIDKYLTLCVMAGLLFGVFSFGPVIDRIGRRKTIMVTCFGLSVVQAPLIFIGESAGVWTYAACRFLSSFFVIAAATSGFIYTTEIVGRKYRTWFGLGNQLLRAVGYISLSVIGYVLHNWHHQMVILTITPLIFCIAFYWILPTSNAWLFSTGRFDEGREGVRKMGKKYPDVNIDDGFIDELEYSVKEKMSGGGAASYTQLDLFKTPGIKRTTLIELVQWFSTKMVYYGLSLGAGALGGNVLVTNLIYGMVDFVCYLVLPFIIDSKKIGRRGGTMIMMTISAIGCVSTALFTYLMVGEELGDHGESKYYMLKKISAFVAKFGISGTFGLVYVYTGELYPTPIRGIAIGLCSAGGRIGGILSPLVNDTANYFPWMPYAIFGVMSIVQVVTVKLLPETLGNSMLTSIDEAEEFYKNAKNNKK